MQALEPVLYEWTAVQLGLLGSWVARLLSAEAWRPVTQPHGCARHIFMPPSMHLARSAASCWHVRNCSFTAACPLASMPPACHVVEGEMGPRHALQMRYVKLPVWGLGQRVALSNRPRMERKDTSNREHVAILWPAQQVLR